ncbi:uncharacterized protein [Mycetomoellerius zeteki]|uniref:uncharacterized protein n=1 Tax=Mycetomoellerius zeteki TaxID=64791 RepID=UPI00084EB96B|nr:PREDICTED: uncharacterized protein LOC108720641 [Trachymyrmex zeteki]
MQQLPGKHAGTSVFVYDGYTYHMDKRSEGLYRCSSRRSLECYAKLLRNPDGTYTLKSQHNHSANDMVLQEFQMKQEMLQMCRETVMKPKEIFDTVCRRNPIAAIGFTYSVIRNTLTREQLRQRPETPQTIAELDVALINYQPIQHIFKDTVTSDDGYKAIIFTSDALLQALVDATEIFMDGTFSVVPKVPPFAQLYTIHVRHMDTVSKRWYTYSICLNFLTCP